MVRVRVRVRVRARVRVRVRVRVKVRIRARARARARVRVWVRVRVRVRGRVRVAREGLLVRYGGGIRLDAWVGQQLLGLVPHTGVRRPFIPLVLGEAAGGWLRRCVRRVRVPEALDRAGVGARAVLRVLVDEQRLVRVRVRVRARARARARVRARVRVRAQRPRLNEQRLRVLVQAH